MVSKLGTGTLLSNVHQPRIAFDHAAALLPRQIPSTSDRCVRMTRRRLEAQVRSNGLEHDPQTRNMDIGSLLDLNHRDAVGDVQSTPFKCATVRRGSNVRLLRFVRANSNVDPGQGLVADSKVENTHGTAQVRQNARDATITGTHVLTGSDHRTWRNLIPVTLKTPQCYVARTRDAAA